MHFGKNRSLKSSECHKFEYDIPVTCCSGNQENYGAFTHESFTQEFNRCTINGSKEDEWRKHIVSTKSNPDEWDFGIDEKCDPSNKFPFLVDQNFSDIIYTKVVNVKYLVLCLSVHHYIGCFLVYLQGCFTHIKQFYQQLLLFLYVAFIILTICSFLMLLAYARNFCKSSHFTNDKSDFSLDVETVSLLSCPS